MSSENIVINLGCERESLYHFEIVLDDGSFDCNGNHFESFQVEKLTTTADNLNLSNGSLQRLERLGVKGFD